jgi:hypothetical protein
MTVVLPSVGNLNNLMSSFNNSAGSSVYAFLESEAINAWIIMSNQIASWILQNNNNTDGLRVLISLADGTVAFDSSSFFNTYVDFKAKKINENHNSRLSILNAMLGNSGVGLESKYSTSTEKFTNYIAQRVGMNTENSLGCVRISINKSN